MAKFNPKTVSKIKQAAKGPFQTVPSDKDEFISWLNEDVTRGLIIQYPWTQLILFGVKSWEIRGSRTNIRGRIAIIQSKSKHIFGYVDLVDCIGPLTLDEWKNHDREHCVGLTNNKLPYPKTYAWVLENPKVLREPIPYKHPQGAVIWVDLT